MMRGVGPAPNQSGTKQLFELGIYIYGLSDHGI